MKKQVIRLTENDLHNIIRESVYSMINEGGNTPEGQDLLGRLFAAKQESEEDLKANDRKEYFARKRKPHFTSSSDVMDYAQKAARKASEDYTFSEDGMRQIANDKSKSKRDGSVKYRGQVYDLSQPEERIKYLHARIDGGEEDLNDHFFDAIEHYDNSEHEIKDRVH